MLRRCYICTVERLAFKLVWVGGFWLAISTDLYQRLCPRAWSASQKLLVALGRQHDELNVAV